MLLHPLTRAVLGSLLLAMAVAANALGQTPAPPRQPDADAAALARGWTALVSGGSADAVRAADEILQRQPGHHAALDLKIEAMRARPLAALDVYEAWLAQYRMEDPFLLVPVARGTLEQLAAGSDAGLQIQALERLALAGDAAAAARLAALPGVSPAQLDLQRALGGNAQAASRLLDPARTGTLPPMMLAQALPAAGAAAAPALRALLQHRDAPVRAAAAIGLGKIGATDAIPDLQRMLNDPEMRNPASIALVRLGRTEGNAAVGEMLRSDVLEMRLYAADAFDRSTPGPWVAALRPLLQDPNGLNRIRAAEVLRDAAPDEAAAVLRAAAGDVNPVVRADASRVLEGSGKVPAANLAVPALRKLLRDTDPEVRLHAAGAILQLTIAR